MKAKFTSRKKLNKQENKLVDKATSYIISWTKKELNRFIDEPVIIQLGEYGFLVGNYKISGLNKNCWTVNKYTGEFVHHFISKTNAILYCTYEVSKNYKSAAELLDLDSKIGKLENDIVVYKSILLNNQDKFKKELIFNRYLDARYQLKTLSDILKKTLIFAKYNKFGNTSL
jgi:hypothetical protein